MAPLTSSVHLDPVAPVVFGLAVILATAKLGGSLAVRLRQPPVLGELLAGVLIGSVDLAGLDWFTSIETDSTIQILSSLGAIILLFEVGLESTVRDMLKVGLPSLLVAVLGVAAPFALGYGVGALLLPDRGMYVHLFLGATLTATSVGVTARVLQDLGKSQSSEARIILGAAVIDDVLGLVILAVVGAIIAAASIGGTFPYSDAAFILLKAAAFLFGALALGPFVSERVFGIASRLHGQGVLLATALFFCFALSFGASVIGLAPIVGAYAAGLILEDVHFRGFARDEGRLEQLIHPISAFLVPVFFVSAGMRVDLMALARIDVLGLAVGLTAAAIAGKQACSLGVIGRPSLNRLAIGLGMIPRGEVGLIFANIGLGLMVDGRPIIDSHVFSAVIIMVIVTTLVTPPALTWSFSRQR